jgi:hypothetical protein
MCLKQSHSVQSAAARLTYSMFSRRKSTAAGGVMKLSLVITWDRNNGGS